MTGGSGFETRAIHAGNRRPADRCGDGADLPDLDASPRTGSAAQGLRSTPGPQSHPPPALEACLASLEGAAFGFCFASGMAAEDAGARCWPPATTWWCDRRLRRHVAAGGQGARPAAWPTTPRPHVARQPGRRVRPETKMVWIETPSNRCSRSSTSPPGRLRRRAGARTVSTTPSPLPTADTAGARGRHRRPLHDEILGGHSDVVGGFAGVNDGGVAERLGFFQNAAGRCPGPWTASSPCGD